MFAVAASLQKFSASIPGLALITIEWFFQRCRECALLVLTLFPPPLWKPSSFASKLSSILTARQRPPSIPKNDRSNSGAGSLALPSCDDACLAAGEPCWCKGETLWSKSYLDRVTPEQHHANSHAVLVAYRGKPPDELADRLGAVRVAGSGRQWVVEA